MFRGSRRKLWQGCARKWSERNTYFSRSFGAEHKRATTGGRQIRPGKTKHNGGTQTGDHWGSPLRRRDKLRSVPIFLLACSFIRRDNSRIVRLVLRKKTGDHIWSPLRRRDKLRSVPIFEMKISHMLRCPSFSAKSHVCECLVFINAHIYAFAALPTFHGIYGKRLKS